MMGLSDGRKSVRIRLAVLIQYRSVTDTQPATQPRCRSYYAPRSGVEPKNCTGREALVVMRVWVALLFAEVYGLSCALLGESSIVSFNTI